MIRNKLLFVGILEKSKSIYINGYDISKYKSEQVYRSYIFNTTVPAKIKDIYIKRIQLTISDYIFYGERNINGQLEIYSFTKKYEEKLLKQFNSYLIRSDDEIRLKNYFDFLLNEYNFLFAKNDLGNAFDKNGIFFYYGPVYLYSIYNDNVCINILNLVQRQDYEILITEKYGTDQVYIRSGFTEDSKFAYNLREYAEHLRQIIHDTGKLYGHTIRK